MAMAAMLSSCGQKEEAKVVEPEPAPVSATALPPLLRKLLAEYAATGLPPAYVPKHDDPEPNA